MSKTIRWKLPAAKAKIPISSLDFLLYLRDGMIWACDGPLFIQELLVQTITMSNFTQQVSWSYWWFTKFCPTIVGKYSLKYIAETIAEYKISSMNFEPEIPETIL